MFLCGSAFTYYNSAHAASELFAMLSHVQSRYLLAQLYEYILLQSSQNTSDMSQLGLYKDE